jgi:hypothetical protein
VARALYESLTVLDRLDADRVHPSRGWSAGFAPKLRRESLKSVLRRKMSSSAGFLHVVTLRRNIGEDLVNHLFSTGVEARTATSGGL